MDINLLPWREQQQKRRKHAFVLALILSAGAALALVALVVLVAQVNLQQQRQVQQQNYVETLRLEAELERLQLNASRLHSQQDISERLLALHKARGRQFDVIPAVRAMASPAVDLAAIDLSQQTVVLYGQTRTAGSVADLLVMLEGHPAIAESQIRTLALDEALGLYVFRIDSELSMSLVLVEEGNLL